MNLYVATRANGRQAWRAVHMYAIFAFAYPVCAKCGHTYGEHTRIWACGACLCDGYEARTP